MPIFNIQNKKILFIHIPKTGGTALEDWFANFGEMSFFSRVIPPFLKCSPQHLSYSNIKSLFQSSMQFDFVFSVVRNPYERIESEFNFRLRNVEDHFRPDFNVWVKSHLENFVKRPFHMDNHWKPQHLFLDEMVKVFKYENGLENILNEIVGAVGIDIEIKELNKKNVFRKSNIHWDTETREIANKIYNRDFDSFNYQMIIPQYLG